MNVRTAEKSRSLTVRASGQNKRFQFKELAYKKFGGREGFYLTSRG
jgi:hypothetical protein